MMKQIAYFILIIIFFSQKSIAIVYMGKQKEYTYSLKNVYLNDIQKQYLKEKKEIRYCIDPNNMPLEGIDGNNGRGIVSDLISVFSQSLNIPFRLIKTESWDETHMMLQKGKCDVIPMIQTSLKDKTYRLTDPYMFFPVGIVTTLDKAFIPELKSILDQKIGIVSRDVPLHIFRESMPMSTPIETSTVNKGLAMVGKENLFGFMGNLYILEYHIRKYFPLSLKVSGKADMKLPVYIAVKHDEKVLFSIMQQLVNHLDKEKLEEIKRSYLPLTYERASSYSMVMKVVFMILVVGIFLYYRQYMLYRYNNQLQKEVSRQVEEIRKKDEILVRKLRMAAMGEMLSMIAHQWRQPLSVISNTLMSIDMKIKMGRYVLETEEGREKFLYFLENKHKQMNQYLFYLSHTIDDFKNFFKPDKKKESIPITEPVERALALMTHTFEEYNIKIQKNYATQAVVDMVSNEIMQVILNILKNSEYNFQEREVSSPVIQINVFEEGGKVYVQLCDNGGGIEDMVMDRIFDPYYSTKDEINGTGLGLYMSKMMIEEQHGGMLMAENTEEGVCFTLIFFVSD